MHTVALHQEGRVGSRPLFDPFLAPSPQHYHGFDTASPFGNNRRWWRARLT